MLLESVLEGQGERCQMVNGEKVKYGRGRLKGNVFLWKNLYVFRFNKTRWKDKDELH